MKRCPTCDRTYTDSNLTFCVEDGTPLKAEEPEDESTLVSPYRPPASYVPPRSAGAGQRRRVWPWILGILGAFALGAAVLVIAAAIMIPKAAKSVQTNTTTDTTEQTENVNVPPPTDEGQVLAQLTDIENEWTSANLNADKKKLARILADDYVGPDAGGGLLGKAEYLDTIERDTRIEKWEFSNLKVQLAGNRATLTGEIKYVIEGQDVAYKFIDKFVWRNGRWQATGSEIGRKE
ncbi:MAG TPA: nuclear transport factor 2 family protein [Pyrinomonadaceae bacterium]|nr:nuclear transport factor 2 family protein [Pyrinomonadaceae bacterium]